MNNEQRLIDLIFEIGITTKMYPAYGDMSTENYAIWIADQLRKCGFDTEPRGMSWGILKK